MNILIFGKNGQVASNLVRLLRVEKDFMVQAFSSSDVDFSDLNKLEKFLASQKTIPDFIINAAAYTNVDKAEDERELADLINHQAVAIIAQYCAKTKIELIHYSTDYVFDGSGTEPFAEDNTINLHPLNHYGRTKLDGEKAIIASNCDYLILRISWIYDTNPNSKNFVNTITKLAQKQEEISVVGDQIGSPTSAEFVALNTISIIKKFIDSKFKLENCLKKIYHLNNGKYISWYDFAVEIIDNLKKEGHNLRVKKINHIKTSEYETKAIRPLNSRLAGNFFVDNIS